VSADLAYVPQQVVTSTEEVTAILGAQYRLYDE
jgi:hypothetical protein